MLDSQNANPQEQKFGSRENSVQLPSISLPTGGGAIRGIDEKLSVNPATGTASLNLPIFATPDRADFFPKLSLSYDSGSGNGPFGLGWTLSVPAVTRKTAKGLPRYRDAENSDVFLFSGIEDLVPYLARRAYRDEWLHAPVTRLYPNRCWSELD